MARLFMVRSRWYVVLALFAAAYAWFFLTLVQTGTWQAFGLAQGGTEPVWLDLTPFFPLDLGRDVIANIQASNEQSLAYRAYWLDGGYMLLSAVALASLIGFAARLSGVVGRTTGLLLAFPAIRLICDATENAMLAATISGSIEQDTGLQIASLAGGLKALSGTIGFFGVVILLALAAIRKLRA